MIPVYVVPSNKLAWRALDGTIMYLCYLPAIPGREQYLTCVAHTRTLGREIETDRDNEAVTPHKRGENHKLDGQKEKNRSRAELRPAVFFSYASNMKATEILISHMVFAR